MRYQVGSFLQQVPNSSWAVTNEAGGNLTTAGTINLYVQLLNRLGLNLLSISVVATYSAGDRLAITFNSNIVREGEDVHRIIVSGENTGNNTDTVQLAEFIYKQEQIDGTVVVESLPATIYLSEDDHLETAVLNVATITALPSSPVGGMLRYVDDEAGKLYRYNNLTASWVEHYFNTAATFLSATTDLNGADQGLSATAILPPPIKSGDNDSAKIRFWLVNDEPENGGVVVTAGTNVNLKVSVNGATGRARDGASFNSLFAGLIKFELIGYYRLLNGAFDNSPDGVGIENIWYPPNSLLEIATELPGGYVAVFDLWLSYPEAEIANKGISATDCIGIEFTTLANLGTASPLAIAFGNERVFGEGDRALIVPKRVLSGQGIAQGFDFEIKDFLPLVGLQASTSNQQVLIDGSTGGTVRISNTLIASESIRGIVSTEGGFGQLSPFSNEITAAAGEGLEITFSHPVSGSKATIRGDYTDPLIAGNPNADWNNPDIRLLIRKGLQWYQKDDLLASDTANTQTLNINDLTGFTELTSGIPDYLNLFGSSFGLFAPGTPTVSSTIGGNLDADSYTVAFWYEYPNPNAKITRISHDTALGAMPTLKQSFDELNNLSRVYPEKLTVVQARLLEYSQLEDKRIFPITINGSLVDYYWDATSLLTDDGKTAIAVSGVMNGRLRPQNTLGITFQNGSTIFNPYSKITIGSGILVEEDAVGNAVSLRIDESLLSPVESVPSLVSDTGNLLLSDTGNILNVS